MPSWTAMEYSTSFSSRTRTARPMKMVESLADSLRDAKQKRESAFSAKSVWRLEK